MFLENQIYQQLKTKLFKEVHFETFCMEVFKFQYNHCKVYRDFIKALNLPYEGIDSIDKIPFLPINFFKTHQITTVENANYTIFESSGTTNNVNKSRHFVSDLPLYEKNFLNCFERFYGPVSNYSIHALLPSYLERENASLVYMCQGLIDASKNEGGFYLNDLQQLSNKVLSLQQHNIQPIVIGVTFALIELAQQYAGNYSHCIFIETGGMKGKGKELTREELHRLLSKKFEVDCIHSEYGMTELLSQAYMQEEGVFKCPPTMRVFVRDLNDPFVVKSYGKGVINIIDLANLGSCSFIATQDIGEVFKDGNFSILGRVDNSDVRGCNLLTIN